MEVPKLPGSASSLDDLGQKVVSGFVSRDDSALAALRLTMLEYTESIWPELPASEASLNVPLEYVWNDIEARNRRALNRMGVWLAGRSIEALGVECRGEVLELSTFRIHTDCWVAVRSPRRVLADVQLFKDVVERSGGYKVFRYYER
jgi:hypothetical protein